MERQRGSFFFHPSVWSGVLFSCAVICILFYALTFHFSVTQAASSWKRMSSPNGSNSMNTVTGIAAVAPNNIWAVGNSFQNPAQGSNATTAIIEHWDGKHWGLVPIPVNSPFDRLFGVAAVSNNDVWAVGSTALQDSYNDSGALIAHWDGTVWSIMPCPLPPKTPGSYQLSSIVALAADNIWAVGTYSYPFDSVPLAMHWDGNAWSVVPIPAPIVNNGLSSSSQAQLSSIAAVSPTNIWAVGGYDINSYPLTEHWDGTQWSIVNADPTIPTASFQAVSTDQAGDVWAVGTMQNANNTFLVEQWIGTAWKAVSSPDSTQSLQGYLAGVRVISSNDILVVGQYTNAGRSGSLIAQWNGTAWLVQQSLQKVNLNVATSIKHIALVGGFISKKSGTATLIERKGGF